MYQCANLDLNFNDKRYCFFFQGLDFADSESTGTSFGPLALGSSGDEDGDDEEIVLDPYDEEYKPYKPSPGIQCFYSVLLVLSEHPDLCITHCATVI